MCWNSGGCNCDSFSRKRPFSVLLNLDEASLSKLGVFLSAVKAVFNF